MKNIWVVYTNKVLSNKYGNFAFDWMKEAASRHGFNAIILFSEDLSFLLSQKNVRFFNKDVEITTPDAVLMRCYDFALSTQLELLDIPVFNSTKSMQLCRNKLHSHQQLQSEDLNLPNTIFATSSLPYQTVASRLENEIFIVKGLEGSQGEEVFLIKNEDDYSAAKKHLDDNFLAQSFIATSHGKDVRVYVVGEKVVGCVQRKATSGFRSNYAQGATISEYKTTPEIENIAKKCRKAIGFDFAGIDLLFGEKGFVICEINGNAGFRTITQVSDVDLPNEMFSYIKSALES